MAVGTMDFFAAQDAARRKTSLLVVYYAIAVLFIVAAVYAAVTLTIVGNNARTSAEPTRRQSADAIPLWDPELLAIVTGATLLIVGGGTLYKMAQLSGGGKAIAGMLGGKAIDSGTADPDERRILNVVEEMAIAAGVPVPPVFILNDERGINAFAAGYTPESAVIAVTRGCVEQLSRGELQGVIAHEFSHILNGDMRLNIRLMGVLNGILCIALIGYGVMRASAGTRMARSSRRGGRGGGAAIILLGVALIVIGYVGVFFAKLIKSAVSRQREYLADASAVQFTRNPNGIGGALKKIAGLSSGSRIRAAQAEEASHMFFANGLKGGVASLLATHPPLPERITRIDPSFNAAIAQAPPRETTTAASPPQPAGASGFTATPADVMQSIGAPRAEHLTRATGLLAAIPPPLRHAARDPFGARALVYFLLLDADADVRNAQLLQLGAQADTAVMDELKRLMRDAAPPATELRIPLIDLATPALRGMSAGQYGAFKRCIEALILSDREIDLFEFALQRIILRHLNPFFTDSRPPRVKYYSLDPLQDDCERLVACLAHWGADTQDEADAAYRVGVAALSDQPADAPMPGVDACGLQAVDDALGRLVQLSMPLKRRIVDACTRCVLADRDVTCEEAELLRAVADALGCPMPPIVKA